MLIAEEKISTALISSFTASERTIMGFFGKLFGGKKPKINAEELVLDITEDKLFVNGKAVDIPCHISVLTNIFGKPRKFVGKNRENINFTWDNLGIYCYTKGNSVVYCIGVKVNCGDISTDLDPKNTFTGTLTIGGEPWEEFMASGEDMEVARQKNYCGYSLFSEYADMENGDKNGYRGAYSGVEFQLSFERN